MTVKLVIAVSVTMLGIAAEVSAAPTEDSFPSEVRNCAFDEHRARNESVYSIRPDILCARGHVEKDLFERIEVAVTSDTKYLVVRSQGGDLDYGLKIGKIVFDRRLTVVVDKGCISACANFIFLAAPEKVILEDSVVGWHGTFARNFTGNLPMLRESTYNGKPRKRAVTDAEAEKMWHEWAGGIVERQEVFFQYTKIPRAILFMDYLKVLSPESEEILRKAAAEAPKNIQKEIIYTPNCFDMEHTYNINGIIYCWHPKTAQELFDLGLSFNDSGHKLIGLVE